MVSDIHFYKEAGNLRKKRILPGLRVRIGGKSVKAIIECGWYIQN